MSDKDQKTKSSFPGKLKHEQNGLKFSQLTFRAYFQRQ